MRCIHGGMWIDPTDRYAYIQSTIIEVMDNDDVRILNLDKVSNSGVSEKLIKAPFVKENFMYTNEFVQKLETPTLDVNYIRIINNICNIVINIDTFKLNVVPIAYDIIFHKLYWRKSPKVRIASGIYRSNNERFQYTLKNYNLKSRYQIEIIAVGAFGKLSESVFIDVGQDNPFNVVLHFFANIIDLIRKSVSRAKRIMCKILKK